MAIPFTSKPSALALLLLALSVLSSLSLASRPLPCNALLISYTITSSQSTAFVSVFRVVRPIPRQDADFIASRRPYFLPERPHRASTAADFASLHDRAKDILVVVVGLLFGVGCGALTAATMYLAWSLVSNRFEVSGFEEDEEEDEIESAKRNFGYVKIPSAAGAAAGAEMKGLKDGYEGN